MCPELLHVFWVLTRSKDYLNLKFTYLQDASHKSLFYCGLWLIP
jgi:hypothetical protein